MKFIIFLPFNSLICVFTTGHLEFQALYGYAPHLGKITVAEQVETDEIRQLMADIGVDRVQGWAVGYPRPIDELLLGQRDSQ